MNIKKHIHQVGRSMVEIIGVLAIIGVLSVGAIAGYSNAMTKHKLNKQTVQFTSLLQQIFYYEKELKISTGSVLLHEMLYKLKSIPDEMIVSNKWDTYNSQFLKDSFKNQMSIWYRGTAGYIELIYYVYNKNLDACINLYQIAKSFDNDLSSITGFYGKESCIPSRKCLKDATIIDFEAKCKQIFDDSGRIYFTF